MNRRNFGLLASTSLASAVAVRPAAAQSAPVDPGLLKTTLTPMGGERAGNADGSIPAWTGGLVSAPATPTQNTIVNMFEDEQPLYTVNASNMAQYANLLSVATVALIQKYGLYLKVYKTHRTAAWPQYVYDNAALNVTRAKLDPRGGRFGFVGAYGGAPFPIINTAEPMVGGAQLIWNHLTSWAGFYNHGILSSGCAVINGSVILVNASDARFIYPFYDPNGSPETYDGYLSKEYGYAKAPSSVQGQETIVWHSSNVNVHPDIIWSLLNGQGRVRKDPNESYDSPNPQADGISTVDEAICFYGNPSKFDWTFIEKKELLVPYSCNAMSFKNAEDLLKPHFPDPEVVRWEKHRVWVVEATLHPGERNIIPKRRLYIDEDSWLALLGEGYDADNRLEKSYVVYPANAPSRPGVYIQSDLAMNLLTGDYATQGQFGFGSLRVGNFIGPLPSNTWDPQSMAATSSF